MAKSQEILQIEQINTGLTVLNTTLNSTSERYMALVNVISQGNQSIKSNAVSFDNLAKAQKQTTDEGKKLDALDKQLLTSEQKLKQVEDSRLKTIVQNKVATQEATKAIKDKVQADKAEIGSIDQLRARNKELTKLRNSTTTSTEKGRQAIAKYNAELNRNNKVIKSNSDGLTKQKIGIGGYMKSMLAATGIMVSAAIVFRAFFNVIKNGFQTSFKFEYAMSQVKAITRATSKDFEALRGNAISLGSATKFTATEVAGLQKEYAKLGFTTTEILRITKATLDLAAATGADLATSATIAGATLRQFQLDASEMQRVVDVMALSFSSSALDINKWETSMQNAGPVASAVGDTIEKTSAKLSVLANSGLDASISGTSLRNIYLELERQGLTWNQAMVKIGGSQNKASASLELFGKRGAVAGLILADNTEQLIELEEAYGNAEGSAQAMADTMLDNVQGSATILKSAWEGLILRTNESNGALKGFLDTLSMVVSTINTKGKPAIDRLFDHRQIETFGDKWKFVRDQGVGFGVTLMSALFRSKETVQEWADEMSAAGDIVLEEQLKIEDARLKQDAEEKRISDEKLKRMQAEVDAEEKAAEEELKRKEKFMRDTKAMDPPERIEMEQENDLNVLRKYTGLTNEEIKKRTDYEIDMARQKADAIAGISAQLGVTLGAFASGQIKSFKDLSKELLLIALEALERTIMITQVEMLAKEIASKGFLGIATATVKIGLIEAAFAGIKGFIQNFEKGTDSAPSKGIFGESGKELMFTRSGDVMLAEQPTYFEGSKFKGAKILSNPETEKMIKMSDRNSGGHQITDERIIKGLHNVEKAIKNKPVMIFDTKNRVIGQATSKHTEIYLNRLIRN